LAATAVRTTRRRSAMADVVYLGVTLVFFWLSRLLVELCERL